MLRCLVNICSQATDAFTTLIFVYTFLHFCWILLWLFSSGMSVIFGMVLIIVHAYTRNSQLNLAYSISGCQMKGFTWRWQTCLLILLHTTSQQQHHRWMFMLRINIFFSASIFSTYALCIRLLLVCLLAYFKWHLFSTLILFVFLFDFSDSLLHNLEKKKKSSWMETWTMLFCVWDQTISHVLCQSTTFYLKTVSCDDIWPVSIN